MSTKALDLSQTSNFLTANSTNLALDVTGNITVGGTVDGRDVAADGSKLDGIESGADATDTTNVAAAGALMDSELTSEASVKALDQGVATTDSPDFAGLTVDTDTLYVDSANDRVGIGTTGPLSTIDARGIIRGYQFMPFTDTDSAATPSIAMAADPDTGFHRPAGNTIGVSTNGSERMRIDGAGRLLVGVSSITLSDENSTPGMTFFPGGFVTNARDSVNANMYISKIGAISGDAFEFNVNGSEVGSISVTPSATSYNTSSDERLKENIADAQPASDLIDGIQVREFDWKADGEHQRYGMIAQELETVAPEAVTKGETEDDMWAVDYSKLVPMLIKEIQDLRKRVAELENTQ